MAVASLLNVSQKLSHSSKEMWNMVKLHVYCNNNEIQLIIAFKMFSSSIQNCIDDKF
jgi:hypothetical protein